MRSYDRIICAAPRDLDAAFRVRYAEMLSPDVRGFGFFCWKPQIIHKVLESLTPGDILHYCDVGCHLNPAGRWRLEEYFSSADKSASWILAFGATPLPDLFGPLAGKTPFPGWINGAWCKADALAYFGLADDARFIKQPITIATTAFFRRSASSVEIVERWRRAFEDDFRLIDDSPSQVPNQSEFVAHRHDQALFTCLCHLYGVETLSNGELELHRSEIGRGNWDLLQHNPIHAKREKDASRYSRIMASLANRFRRIALGR